MSRVALVGHETEDFRGCLFTEFIFFSSMLAIAAFD